MLSSKLRKLRLGHAASVLEAHHQSAINEKLGYLEFLGRLVDDELQTREHKGLDKRMRTARFPVLKTLEEFDFAFQPSLVSGGQEGRIFGGELARGAAPPRPDAPRLDAPRRPDTRRNGA
ncbi:MAG: ATP-binding protein [Vulcanimicrobiaceae bacterium]